MPIVVVEKETTLEALAARILKARTSKAATARAIAAIREANLGRDLDVLQPGQVVVVPPLEAARAEFDVVGSSVDSVLAGVKEAVDALAVAAAAAGEAARAERAEVAEILGAAEVKRAAGQDPTLKATLGELKTALREDEKTAAAQADALKEGMGAWAADLDALGGLLG